MFLFLLFSLVRSRHTSSTRTDTLFPYTTLFRSVVLTVFFMYFFRNPNRITEQDEEVVYSPADGRVMAVEDIYDDEYLNEDAVKVTIFLSVFNVQIGRAHV